VGSADLPPKGHPAPCVDHEHRHAQERRSKPEEVSRQDTDAERGGKDDEPPRFRAAACLVSRKWTGRTLDDYRDARREHVTRMLGAVGIRVDRDTDEDPDHTRYTWALVGPTDPNPPDRTELLLRAINQRRRWRAEYDRARSAIGDLEPTGRRRTA
jgi:hypothetical protein